MRVLESRRSFRRTVLARFLVADRGGSDFLFPYSCRVAALHMPFGCGLLRALAVSGILEAIYHHASTFDLNCRGIIGFQHEAVFVVAGLRKRNATAKHRLLYGSDPSLASFVLPVQLLP